MYPSSAAWWHCDPECSCGRGTLASVEPFVSGWTHSVINSFGISLEKFDIQHIIIYLCKINLWEVHCQPTVIPLHLPDNVTYSPPNNWMQQLAEKDKAPTNTKKIM